MTGRIVVLEPDCEGEAHLPFNGGIVSALVAAAPAARIELHAAASHRAALMTALSPAVAARLDGGPLAGAGHGGRRRLVDPALLRGLRGSAARAGDRVVVLTATRGGFFALALATRLRWLAPGTAFAIGHSLLADLWDEPRRNPLLRRVDLIHALRAFLGGGHRLVVLEAGIEAEFAARFPDLAGAVRLWPHPLPPATVAATAGPVCGAGNRPRIGFLGWTGGDKGFGAFLAASRDFAGVAEFHAIGHGAPGDGGAGLEALATAPRAGFWPRAEYVRRAAALDFVCMFYDARAYRFVASGVLMDALAFGIPVIAPDIPLLARIAARHGEIGLLYDGVQGRDAAVAAAIALAGTPRHAAMKRNIAAAAAARGLDRLSRTIAADLELGPPGP